MSNLVSRETVVASRVLISASAESTLEVTAPTPPTSVSSARTEVSSAVVLLSRPSTELSVAVVILFRVVIFVSAVAMSDSVAETRLFRETIDASVASTAVDRVVIEADKIFVVSKTLPSKAASAAVKVEFIRVFAASTFAVT